MNITSPYTLMKALHRADPADGAGLRAVVSAARDSDVIVELDPDADPAGFERPAWLLAWCTDLDGCDFYAIPESALDDARRADLVSAAGACFASSSDTWCARMPTSTAVSTASSR